MKRAAHILVLLLALLIGAQSGRAGVPSRAYLPTVQAQSAVPPIVTLVESDTTFVSAAHDPSTGQIFVAYIDRAHQNRAHFTELIGDALHEVQQPALAAAPAFTPPDSPKDADSAILAFDGWVYWFTSSREEDRAGAPFKLKLRRFRP